MCLLRRPATRQGGFLAVAHLLLARLGPLGPHHVHRFRSASAVLCVDSSLTFESMSTELRSPAVPPPRAKRRSQSSPTSDLSASIRRRSASVRSLPVAPGDVATTGLAASEAVAAALGAPSSVNSVSGAALRDIADSAMLRSGSYMLVVTRERRASAAAEPVRGLAMRCRASTAGESSTCSCAAPAFADSETSPVAPALFVAESEVANRSEATGRAADFRPSVLESMGLRRDVSVRGLALPGSCGSDVAMPGGSANSMAPCAASASLELCGPPLVAASEVRAASALSMAADVSPASAACLMRSESVSVRSRLCSVTGFCGELSNSTTR